LSVAEAGASIGLRGWQRHAVPTDVLSGFSLGNYSGTPARLDLRQSLSGLTWTLDSGSVWKTTVTFTDQAGGNGTDVNSTYFGLWLTNTFLDWMVGGADIAENISDCEAEPGSFTIHKTGSTEEDPRTPGENSTSFDVYVHLPDGSNPNGKDLLIASRDRYPSFQGGTHKNIEFVGAWGKDAIGVASYSGAVPTFDGCRHLDFGCHGYVGPGHFRNHYARGKGRPGMTGYANGRSAGAAINCYTSSFLSTTTLAFHNLDLNDATNGLYAHGSNNRGYKQWLITGIFKARNCGAAIQVDVPNTTTRESFLVDGIECSGYLDIEGSGTAFICDATWRFTGGGVVSVGNASGGSSVTLVNFVGTTGYLLLKDATVESILTHVPFTTRHNLVNRTANASHSAPTLELDNVQDVSATTDQKLKLPRSTGTIIHEVHLILKNGTILGSLMDQASGTNYPESLTVGAGCTFGLGDRTGPEIEAAMTAAGKAHSISHNTTIVNRAGAILSNPGW